MRKKKSQKNAQRVAYKKWKRSKATQNTACPNTSGAAVRWLRAWSDYFGRHFLWFVSDACPNFSIGTIEKKWTLASFTRADHKTWANVITCDNRENIYTGYSKRFYPFWVSHYHKSFFLRQCDNAKNWHRKGTLLNQARATAATSNSIPPRQQRRATFCQAELIWQKCPFLWFVSFGHAKEMNTRDGHSHRSKNVNECDKMW